MIEIEIENVSEEVLKEAKARADQILKEASVAREKMLAEARDEAEKMKDAMRSESEAAAERARAVEISKAKMNAKQLQHSAKIAAMNSIYDQFYAGIDREKLLKSLFDLGSRSFDAGTLYEEEKALPVAKKIFPNAKPADIKGGLIIESRDGNESVNLSMEVIEELMKERTFSRVYSIVFGENK